MRIVRAILIFLRARGARRNSWVLVLGVVCVLLIEVVLVVVMRTDDSSGLEEQPVVPGASPMYDRAYGYTDHVPWSQSPPGGLAASRVPMFVQFGFDDNFRSGLVTEPPEGVTWVTNLFRNLRNPPGNSNAATFDNAPVRVSFYSNTTYISDHCVEDPVLVRSAWRVALNDGHEVGNHTHSHRDGSGFSVEEWELEIRTHDDWVTRPCVANEPRWSIGSGIGASLSKIEGFRAPYGKFNDNTMTALVRLGFTYDISIEEGWQLSPEGHEFNWPYTLDSGSPGAAAIGRPVGSHPGLWELGMTPFAVPRALREELGISKITGADSSLFISRNLNQAQALAVLKYSLDQRLAGNRAPLFICAHTNLYTDAVDLPNTSAQERRDVIEEFLTYALSKPEVRIVTARNVIEWMRDPVPLGADP